MKRLENVFETCLCPLGNLHSLIHSLIFEITLTDGKVSAKYSIITVHLVYIYFKVATLSQIP